MIGVSGYDQHDSQELLRALLDGLENEENGRVKCALLDNFRVACSDFNTYEFKELQPDSQAHIKAYFKSWRPTVNRLFGGTICSRIKCSACHKVTQVVEEFMDLSIPIRPAPSGKNALKASVDDRGSRKVSKRERKRAEAAKKRRDKEARRQKKNGKKAAVAQVPVEETAYDAIRATSSVSSLGSSSTTQSSAMQQRSAVSNGSVSSEETDQGAYATGITDQLSAASAFLVGDDQDELDDDKFGFNDSPPPPVDDTPAATSDAVSGGDRAAADASVLLGTSKPPDIPIQNGRICEPRPLRPGEYSVDSCLNTFCVEEILDGDNM